MQQAQEIASSDQELLKQVADFVTERVGSSTPFTTLELVELTGADWQRIERALASWRVPSHWLRSWVEVKSHSGAKRKTIMHHPPDFDPKRAPHQRPVAAHTQNSRLHIPCELCRDLGWKNGLRVFSWALDDASIKIAPVAPTCGVASKGHRVNVYGSVVITPGTHLPDLKAHAEWSIAKKTDGVIVTAVMAGTTAQDAIVRSANAIKAKVDIPASIVRSAGWRSGQTVWVWLEDVGPDAYLIVIKRGVAYRPPNERAKKYTVDTYGRIVLRPQAIDKSLPNDGWTARAFDLKIELTRPREKCSS